MEGPLLTKSEDITIDGDSSSNDEHNIGITINDNSSSTPHEAVNVERCNPCTEEWAWCLIDFLLHLVQIIAAIVVVTQAKDEHPKALLLVWIIGHICGCVITLLIPLIDCVFSRCYLDIELLKKILEYFFVSWAFVLLIWIYHSSLSSLYDNTQHFWLCMAFLAFTCIRYVPTQLVYSAICLVLGVIIWIFAVKGMAIMKFILFIVLLVGLLIVKTIHEVLLLHI